MHSSDYLPSSDLPKLREPVRPACKLAFESSPFKSKNKRLKAVLRITVKNNESGECHKLELVRFPFSSRKFMLRFDGKASAKMREASFSQICEKMRKLLIIMAKQKSCTRNR